MISRHERRQAVFETILEKDFFDYSLGGYFHQERWACTRRCFIMNSEGEEDSRNIITTIGRKIFIDQG
jgi:hypothetical protein